MSQQRILLAVCVFGAVVALASAQSFDMSSCQSAFREQSDKYTACMRSSVQKYTTSLQSSTNGAADTSPFKEDLDQLSNSMSTMMNTGSNFDMDKWSTTMMQNTRTISSMMRTAIALYTRMPQGAFSDYMEFSQGLITCQSTLVQSVSTSCVPARVKSSSSQ